MGSRHCSGITAHSAATVVIAALWALWHVPLFCIHDTYQAGLGWGTAGGWLFFVNLLAQSLIMTALQLAAPTVWSAVIFHWSTNLSGAVLPWSLVAEPHRTAWTIVGAAIVVSLRPPWGMRTILWQPQPHRATETATPLPAHRSP
jgi:membrane protease YdiL (CAAX protease family)